MSGALGWWRHAPPAGGTDGARAAHSLADAAGWMPCQLGAAAAIAIDGRGPPTADEPSRSATIGWLAALAAVGALAGLGTGDARLAAIDAGAFEGPAGSAATALGHVAA